MRERRMIDHEDEDRGIEADDESDGEASFDAYVAEGRARRARFAARLVQVDAESASLLAEKARLTADLANLDLMLSQLPAPAVEPKKEKPPRAQAATPVRGVKADLAVYIEEWKHTEPSETRTEDEIVAAMGQRIPGSKKAAVIQALIASSNPKVVGRVLERIGSGRGNKTYRFWSDVVRASKPPTEAFQFSEEQIADEVQRIVPLIDSTGEVGISVNELVWKSDGGDTLLTEAVLQRLIRDDKVEHGQFHIGKETHFRLRRSGASPTT